jgi:hypothetical protein
MASKYESLTDEATGILEKAVKSKPKDTKARTDLHKKANAKLKDLQKHLADSVATFTKNLDSTTRTLEEAVGVAENEAKLFDREIVRHLKHAIKLSKAIDRPKGWTDDFDKAVKTVAGWDPKAEGVKELEQGIKSLEAGKKCIKTSLAATNKQEVECNGFVDKAILDLDSIKDEELKKKISPYLCRYAEFFEPK